MGTEINKLNSIKDKLVNEKDKKNRLEGKLELAYDELARLGYKSVDIAKNKLDEIEQSIEDMEEELATMLNDFEGKYPELYNG